MGWFGGLFKKKSNVVLPCERTGDCPYEYDKESDRDVEGMPFVEGDPRRCPEYGHVCPEYMEDFNLSVAELNIRATIHCGVVLDQLGRAGKLDPDSPEHRALKERFEEVVSQYPPERYPQYY